MDDGPVEEGSTPEPVPASSVTYQFNEDERPTDPTLPQNRPNKVEEPSSPEKAISIASEHQESLHKDEGLEERSQISHIPLKVSPCANVVHTTIGGTTQNCHKDGTMSCGKCHLVRVSGPPTNLVFGLKSPNEDQIILRWAKLCPLRIELTRSSLIRPLLTCS